MNLTTARRKAPTSSWRIVASIVRETPAATGTWPDSLDTPERGADYWKHTIATQPDHEPDKESLIVVMLNSRLFPFAWHRVSLGTLNESACHPREVFRPAIAAAAFSIVVMHNHPSGDPSPSRADEQVTRRLNEAADLLQIRLLDHLVIGTPAPGRNSYYSFREAGIIA